MEPTSVFLPGKFHGREAWCVTVHRVPKDLDITEQLSTTNLETHSPSLSLPSLDQELLITLTHPPWPRPGMATPTVPQAARLAVTHFLCMGC